MAKLSFRLVMPERELLDTEADMVVVPGIEGDFGVMHGHAPLISIVRPGVLEVLRHGAVELDALVGSSHDPRERYAPGQLDPPPRLAVRTAGAKGGTWAVPEAA